MEITGKVTVILPIKTGTSKSTGNAWATQDYVIETEGQYPKHVCFNIFGDEKIKACNIQMGENITVSIDIDAREYEGRWFNTIRGWKVERPDATSTVSAPQSEQPNPVESGEELPF
jgi:hypothetical protein